MAASLTSTIVSPRDPVTSDAESDQAMGSTMVTVVAAPRTDSQILVAGNDTAQSPAPRSTRTNPGPTLPSLIVAPTSVSETAEDGAIRVSGGKISTSVSFIGLAAATTLTVVVTSLAAASCSD